MTESVRISEHLDPFLTAHPSRDGWKIYKISDRLGCQFNLSYMLDCLRDLHPEALKYRFAVNEVSEKDFLGTSKESHAIEPGVEWDLEKELDADDWAGLIEIEWKGKPIHFYALLQDKYRRDRTILVATKSNAALRDFNSVLEAYGQARNKKDHREIHVVNGSNILVPHVSWEEVILPPGMAEDILANVKGFFQARERYREMGIPYRLGFLFTGPPGCGKTLTLKALANSIDSTVFTVLTRIDVDEDDVHHAFHMATKHAPSIIIFEDLDRLVRSPRLSLSYFLNALDGLKEMNGLLVIATSNNPGNLDPALLHRPSRFDRVWRFPLPDEKQRFALLSRKGQLYFSQEALRRVAEDCKDFSMAYVQEIIVNALLECAHAGIEPTDRHLFRSLKALKAQRKAASKIDEVIADRESLGFFAPPRKLSKLLSEDFDDEELEE